MKISIVVAKGDNQVIGRKNGLPWHLPSDLRHFKNTTRGGHVLMGRKTFDSLRGPLPGRTHFIITRNAQFAAPKGHYAFSSIEDAISAAESLGVATLFILGGAEIYSQALPITSEMIITEVHASPEGDTFFPEVNWAEWTECDRKTIDHTTTNDEYSMDFVTYRRK